MTVNRMFTNICTSDVPGCAAFFVALLELRVHFDSDWFVILVPPGNPGYEVGIIRADHELVPERERAAPKGVYLTFVVDDVEAAYARALEMDADIVQPPRDEFYGQRRFLTRSPDGLLVDVSAPVGPPP